MPQQHHRYHQHADDSGAATDVDVDDEHGRLALVDAASGMLADHEREAIADAVGVDDDDELSPEEAALHIERFDLDAFD